MRCSSLIVMFLAVSLFMSTSVYAVDTVIHDGFFTGDYITVANDTFLLIGTDPREGYWNNYSAVIFKNNVTRSLFKIDKGECKVTEYYTYCFNSTYYDWDKPFTYEGSILEPTMMIDVFYYSPSVTLEKSATLELTYGDGLLVENDFTNTGSKEAEVHYTEQLPTQFVVANCNGCSIANNKVTADVRLGAGEKKTVSYSVQYFEYANFTWTANYSYTYDDKYSSELRTINSHVLSPYTLVESLTRSVTTELGDISTFEINLTNTQLFSGLKANISIKNGVVKKYTGLEKANDTYTFEGLINPTTSKTFSIVLDSYLVGEFPITVDATMEAHNHIFRYSQTHSFNVSLNPLTPSLVVDKETAEPNDTIHLVASLKNTDEHAIYIYVYAHLLPQDQQWTFHAIAPGKELILYNDTFPIPVEDDDLHIILSGLYRTSNLQDQTFKLEKIIDVIGREPKVFNDTEEPPPVEEPAAPQEPPVEEPPSDDAPIETQPNETIIQDKPEETPEEPKKDFVTNIIEAIDSFIKGLFSFI